MIRYSVWKGFASLSLSIYEIWCPYIYDTMSLELEIQGFSKAILTLSHPN